MARVSAPVFHEVSPMADPSSIAILSERGYQPIESSVLYKPLAEPSFIHIKAISRKWHPRRKTINVKVWNIPEFTEFLDHHLVKLEHLA